MENAVALDPFFETALTLDDPFQANDHDADVFDVQVAVVTPLGEELVPLDYDETPTVAYAVGQLEQLIAIDSCPPTVPCPPSDRHDRDVFIPVMDCSVPLRLTPPGGLPVIHEYWSGRYDD